MQKSNRLTNSLIESKTPVKMLNSLRFCLNMGTAGATSIKMLTSTHRNISLILKLFIRRSKGILSIATKPSENQNWKLKRNVSNWFSNTTVLRSIRLMISTPSLTKPSKSTNTQMNLKSQLTRYKTTLWRWKCFCKMHCRNLHNSLKIKFKISTKPLKTKLLLSSQRYKHKLLSSMKK